MKKIMRAILPMLAFSVLTGCAALIYNPHMVDESFPQIYSDFHESSGVLLCDKPTDFIGRRERCIPEFEFSLGFRNRLSINDSDPARVDFYYFDEMPMRMELYDLWKKQPKVYGELVRDMIFTNSPSLVYFFRKAQYTGVTDKNPKGYAHVIGTSATQAEYEILRLKLKRKDPPKSVPSGYGYPYEHY